MQLLLMILCPSHEPSDNVTILSRLSLTIERVQKLSKQKIFPQFSRHDVDLVLLRDIIFHNHSPKYKNKKSRR